jgi:hypothetical protein
MELFDTLGTLFQGWLAWGFGRVDALSRIALVAGSAGATLLGTAGAWSLPDTNPFFRVLIALLLSCALFVVFLGFSQFTPVLVDAGDLARSQGVR